MRAAGRRRRARRKRTSVSTAAVDEITVMTTIQTLTPVETYRLAHPYPGILAVRADGNLSERLDQFNTALEQLRSDLLRELANDGFRINRNRIIATGTNSSNSNSNRSTCVHGFPGQVSLWSNDQLLIGGDGSGRGDDLRVAAKQTTANVVIANEDNYLERLSSEFPLVRVLVLPWLRSSSTGGSRAPWDSRTDFANLFVQVSFNYTSVYLYEYIWCSS